MRMRSMFTRICLMTAAVALSALAGCTGADGWREFRSEQGGFSIMVPGRLEQQSQRTATAFGTIEAEVFLVDHGDVGYLISYADYPQALVDESPTDVILDGASLGAVSDSGGKLLTVTKISLGDHAGRELEISSPGGEAMIRLRLFLVGNRLYQISVLARVDVDVTEETARFFDSFQLLPP